VNNETDLKIFMNDSDKEKTFFRILSLCLRSRCPICGQGDLFIPLTQIRSIVRFCLPPEHCNRCSFQFRREPGYYFGILTPLLPIFSLLTGLIFVGIFYFFSRPQEAEQLLLPGAIGTVVGFILFFRPAIAIYISLDHAIDPPPKRTLLK
jgi:uncharacterized protein (DUF983 family)